MGEQWTLDGRVVVDHLLPELQAIHGTRSGLAGVVVHVSARTKLPAGWSSWTSWGTAVTSADGRFGLRHRRGDDRRQFRIALRFDSPALRIGDGPDDWHELYSDADRGHERRAGRHELGDLRVPNGLARRLGDLWVLCRRAIDALAAHGADYAFTSQVVVSCSLAAGLPSHWSARNGCCHLAEAGCPARTLLQVLMHKWAHDHCVGDGDGAWPTERHGGVPPGRADSAAASFLEAFADWAAVRLLQALAGGRLRTFLDAAPDERPDHPFGRDYVGRALPRAERRLANLEYTTRGWYALFTLLACPCLERIDVDQPFTDSSGEDDRYAFLSLFADLSDFRLGYSVGQLLGLFLAHPAHQVPPLSTAEMRLAPFLARASRLLPGFDAAAVRQLTALLDPAPAEIRAPVAHA